MRNLRISFITVLALVLAVLIPGQMSSSAVATITKTVTVKKADNTPYANALVSFVYWDDATQMQKIVEPSTTNAAGVATVSMASGLRLNALAVEPAAGDLTHGIYLNDQDYLSSDSDQSFTATLKLANLNVKIQKSDNTDAPGGYGINFPELGGDDSTPSYRVILRAGTFGIALSQTLSTTKDFSIDINGPGNANEFDATYGLRAIDVSGLRTPVIFTDATYSAQLAPVAGVYVFKLKAGDLSGQLQNSSGNSTSLPDGVLGSVSLYSSLSDGSINYNSCCTSSKMSINGSFKLSLEGKPAGKYYPVAQIAGSATIPTFVGSPIWKDSSGRLSSDNSTFTPAASFVLGLKIPASGPNIVLKYQRTDGTVEAGTHFLFGTSNPGFFLAGFAANGVASFVLPNGSFRTNLMPLNKSYKATNYLVTVSGGVATLKTLAGVTVNATAGVHILDSRLSNLRIFPVNPLDAATPLWRGINASVTDSTGNNQIAQGNLNNGSISLALPDGTGYVLSLSTQPDTTVLGIGTQKFTVDVAGGVVTVKNRATGNIIAAEPDGSYKLSLARANVFGRTLLPDGSAAGWIPSTGGSVGVDLEKYVTDHWEYWGNHTDSLQNGRFYLAVSDAGTYRLRFQPWGYTDVAATFSPSFIVTNTPADFNLGDITLNSPSLKVIVRAPGGTQNLTDVYVNLRQGNNWLDGASANQNGIVALTVAEAGEYDLIVNPPYNGGLTNVAKKTYSLTMTQNNDGSFTASIAGKTKDVTTGAFILELGVPTLMGTVTEPDGVTRLPRARIVATNTETGQQMWDYSIDSDPSGNWAMALPAGKYKVHAQSPWNDSRFGDGEDTSEFTVNASGVAIGLANASTLALSVANPTWSGIIKAPTGDTLMTNARICMMPSSSNLNWICANTDREGKWALSKPSGFTGFDASTEIEIGENYNPVYAPKRVRGITAAVELLGTYVAGQTFSNITLRLAQPNTEITVLADGAPVANVWVNADRDNEGWLGGGTTNADGVAKLNITNPGTAFRVRAQLENNPTVSENYAATQVSFTSGQISAGTANGVFSGTINLAQPNLKGTLSEPGPGGALISGAWIEIYNVTKNVWEGGSNTNSAGKFALNLATPSSGSTEYRLTANNRWQSTSNLARTLYKVVINSSGNITLTKVSGGTAVTPSNGLYPLLLSEPAINGTVQLPTGEPVRDSWVVPIYNGAQYWEYGANSKSNGGFGLAVPDGSYSVEADVPWNSSTPLAKSAKCNVVVSGGTITNAGSVDCVDDVTKNVTLKLRDPNLTFKFIKPDVTPVAGVAWANISVSVGNWSTWGHSYSDGSVGIFIDKDAIAAANPSGTGTVHINVWVNAPYGDSSVVGWNCLSGDQTKPICKDLPDFTYGNTYPTTNLGNVVFKKPNTKLRVLDPTGVPVGQGAWVVIFKRVQSGVNTWNEWISQGDDTDADGYATFNIEDTSLNFAVEVNAPWNQRDQYAQETYVGSGTGILFDNVNNKEFKLAAPNLTMSVKEAFSPNDLVKWGWIGVEKVDAANNDNWLAWVGGVGIGNNGSAALKLDVNSRYKLQIFPGSSSSGVRTFCTIDVGPTTSDISRVSGKCAAGTIASGNLALTLDAGNVQGHVYRPGGIVGVVGAVVLAEAYDKITSELVTGKNETANTDSTGRYGLQLDSAYNWKLKVFYVNLPTDTPQLRSVTTGESVIPGSGAATIKDFELLVV